MKTSVKMYEKDTNNATSTTTLSNVNPNADGTQLYQMAQQFNLLTTSTLTSAERVDTTELNTKSTPTLTTASQPDGTGQTTWGAVGTDGIWLYIVTNSDAIPIITKNTAYCDAQIIHEGDPTNSYVLTTSGKDPAAIWDEEFTYTDANGHYLSKTGYINSASVTDDTARIVIKLPETDNFAAIETTVYVKYE